MGLVPHNPSHHQLPEEPPPEKLPPPPEKLLPPLLDDDHPPPLEPQLPPWPDPDTMNLPHFAAQALPAGVFAMIYLAIGKPNRYVTHRTPPARAPMVAMGNAVQKGIKNA